MSETQSPWTPVHFEEAEDPEDESEDTSTAKESKGSSKSKSAPKQAESPVSLVLALPKEVTTAITMVADRLERVALALEEQTKEIGKLLKAKPESKDTEA